METTTSAAEKSSNMVDNTAPAHAAALNDFFRTGNMSSQSLQSVNIVDDNAHSHHGVGDSQTSLELSKSSSNFSYDQAMTEMNMNVNATQPHHDDDTMSSSLRVETINIDDICIVADHYRDIINPDIIKRVSIVSDNAFTHDFDSGPVEDDSDDDEEEEEDDTPVDATEKSAFVDSAQEETEVQKVPFPVGTKSELSSKVV